MDGQPLSYGLRGYLEHPVTTSDPTHRTNGSKYFTHDEEMIACVSIISGSAMFGSNPEAVGIFTESFITDRAMIWDKMVKIFQVLYTWTYLDLDKKHHDGIMGYKLIYNYYLGLSNIYHVVAGAEKKFAKCTYTEVNRNWTFNNYYTLHKEQHNILGSLKEHGSTGVDQI